MSSEIAVTMTSAMERALAGAVHEVSVVLVGELAEKHGFDPDTAIATMGLDRFVTRRSTKGVKKTKKESSEPKEKMMKPKIPLPYCGVRNKCNCFGLRLNHGMHTQCTQRPIKGARYCKTCQQQADRSATGKPTYGTIEDREMVGILEFVDPKGKKTVPYANVMKKLNITREAAEAEVKEFADLVGTDTIPEEHFNLRETKRGRPKKESSESDEKEPKKRGRPTKTKKVVASSVEGDLISALVNANDSDDTASVSSTGSRPRLSEEEKARRAQEKADKKAAREAAKAEKEAAKAEKEAAKATALAEKEAAKATALAEKEAAKLLKAETQAKLKAEKDAEKEAAKAKLKAEKDAEKAAAKAAKEAEKQAEKVAAKAAAKAENAETPTLAPLEVENVELEEEEEAEIEAEEFTHEGVTYLRTTDNVLYDRNEHNPVGVWDPEEEKIMEIEEDDEEADEV